MSVSSKGESDDGVEGEGEVRVMQLRQHAYARKRTFEELAPEEQTAMKRSIVLVQRWLDTDYAATLPHNGEALTDSQVPDLLPLETKIPLGPHPSSGPPLMALAPLPPPFPCDDDDRDEADLAEPLEAEDAALVQEQPQITASDFNRGKRLKRLTKLLSGRQATKDFTRLRFHGYILLSSILALHVGCFIAVLITTYNQYSCEKSLLPCAIYTELLALKEPELLSPPQMCPTLR